MTLLAPASVRRQASFFQNSEVVANAARGGSHGRPLANAGEETLSGDRRGGRIMLRFPNPPSHV
jgi:hypothetical protein